MRTVASTKSWVTRTRVNLQTPKYATRTVRYAFGSKLKRNALQRKDRIEPNLNNSKTKRKHNKKRKHYLRRGDTCIQIYTYIRTCMHACMHTYIHACMHAYTQTHTYIHTYIHYITLPYLTLHHVSSRFITYIHALRTCIHTHTVVKTHMNPTSFRGGVVNLIFLFATYLWLEHCDKNIAVAAVEVSS